MIKLTKDTIIENDGKRIKLPAGSTLKVVKENIDEPLKIEVRKNAYEPRAAAITFYYDKNAPVEIGQVKRFIKNNPGFINSHSDENVRHMWGDLFSKGPVGKSESFHCDVELIDDKMVNGVGIGRKGMKVYQAYPKPANEPFYDESGNIVSESTDFERALAKIKPVQK